MILLGGVSLTAVGQPADPAPSWRIDQVQAGMTGKQVEELLGPPATAARQIFSQGTLVQWIYERPERCRVRLRHNLGKEPLVYAIDRPNRPRP